MGAPHAIVPELLTEKNFGRWKIWMKNYLLGKELWDIVEGTEPKPDEATQVAEFRTWRKKNGKALYAIQVSCGAEIFDIISEMDSAKASWDAILAFMVQPISTVKHTEIPDFQQQAPASTAAAAPASNQQAPGSSSSQQAPHQATTQQQQSRSNDDNTWRIHLYEAVVKGDWKKTESLINSHPEALSARLSMGETILHTAVLNDHVHLVVELVKKMSTEDTEITLPYRRNSTALHLAAARRIVKIAEVLVKKNANLLRLRDSKGSLPVTRASLGGNKVMVRYLYSVTPAEELTNLNQIREGTNLLIETIGAEDYDFALEIHRHHPQLTFAPIVKGFTPLEALARKPSAFPSGNRLKFWQRWIYNCIHEQQSRSSNSCSEDSVQTKVSNWLKELSWDVAKIFAPGIEQLYNTKFNNMRALELLTSMSRQVSTLNASEIEERKVLDAMALASEFGIVEFVVKMVKSNPTLLWMSVQSRTIFHTAVAHRRERIWNLIYGLGAQGVEFSTFIRYSDNHTLLHEAGNLAPSSRLNNVSGPAMQMQWELQWFKEVETIVPPLTRGRENKAGKTARTLFTEQHKDLVKEAEKWMKDTASSCMVVTTLIATVMFAAAFTVPGGNDSQKGIPIFLPQTSFMVFIVADALSLFSSTASILMFLSILTSRYAEEDFLKSLPKRLIIGFATLFFSIATMMVAFSATLVIVLHDRYNWVAIPIFSLAGVPIILFALLQLPLFVDMISATYGSSIFRMHTKLSINSVPTQST